MTVAPPSSNTLDAPVANQPSPALFVKVWATLVGLTLTLVLVSRSGRGAAVWGLLTITPLKAGLVFYYFMHLKYEGPLLKGVVLITLGTFLIFFSLLFSDLIFR